MTSAYYYYLFNMHIIFLLLLRHRPQGCAIQIVAVQWHIWFSFVFFLCTCLSRYILLVVILTLAFGLLSC
jgi:hypothetical protein